MIKLIAQVVFLPCNTMKQMNVGNVILIVLVVRMMVAMDLIVLNVRQESIFNRIMVVVIHVQLDVVNVLRKMIAVNVQADIIKIKMGNAKNVQWIIAKVVQMMLKQFIDVIFRSVNNVWNNTT